VLLLGFVHAEQLPCNNPATGQAIRAGMILSLPKAYAISVLLRSSSGRSRSREQNIEIAA
jgi:hypothetical protein